MISTKSLSGALLLVLVAASPSVATEWVLGCEDAEARCTAQGVLMSEKGERAGTIGLQVARDGTSGILFVTTPLGAALAPGLRLRGAGAEFTLQFEVCYPDGCRATVELAPDRLAQFLSLKDVDILMFPYGQSSPVALATPLEGLREAFEDKVPLP